jgi:exodeoxyribonuclease VII large subunit
VAAIAALDLIKLQVARILTRERTALVTQADRVDAGLRSLIQQAEDEHRKFMTVIRTVTHFQLREADQSLEAGYGRLVDHAEQTRCEAELKLDRSMQTIDQRSQLQLGLKKGAIEKAAGALALQATARLVAAGHDLDHARAQMAGASGRWVATASGQVEDSLVSIAARAVTTAEAARDGIETYARIAVGLGPQATLKRGFSIARDTQGRPVTSRAAAMRNPEFTVQFHDGTVPVANRDLDGGPV